MQTQPQLLMLQKTMVVVEGVARKLNPNTNIWTTSKPVLENWLRETKDPINTITDTLNNTSEVLKKLPELPEIMDKALSIISGNSGNFFKTSDVLFKVSVIVFIGSFVSLNQFSSTGLDVVHIFVLGFNFLATPSTTTIVFCNINN